MSAAADICLFCQPGKDGNHLVFPYQVQNAGSVEVYVMDAAPSMVSPSREAKANTNAAVVLAGPGEDVTIGKFIAPLPTDRRVAMPVIPLARRLPPGERLQGRIEIATPLAEISPYFDDLPLRQYELVEVKAVQLAIGYWLAGADGFAALPVGYAPEFYTVVTRNTGRSALRVVQRYPARSLQLFRRTDAFPREMPSEAWSPARVLAAP